MSKKINEKIIYKCTEPDGEPIVEFRRLNMLDENYDFYGEISFKGVDLDWLKKTIDEYRASDREVIRELAEELSPFDEGSTAVYTKDIWSLFRDEAIDLFIQKQKAWIKRHSENIEKAIMLKQVPHD
jgi:hypothetical protein